MPSVTATSQTRRLERVVEIVRACGGAATITQVASALGLSRDGTCYRVSRAVHAGLLAGEKDRGRWEATTIVRLPAAPPTSPVVVTQIDRTRGWEGVVLRSVARKGTVSALDVAAYLNLPSTAAARQRLRPLVLRGVLTYDEAADTYRLGASVEGERAA